MNTTNQSPTLSTDDRRTVEHLTAEFERQWQPNLLEYWSTSLSPYHPALRLAILAAWIQAELRQRWDRNEFRPLDAYLQQFPLLGTADNCPIALIAQELFLRRQHGLSEAELLQRFPTRVHELQIYVGQLVPSCSLPPFPAQPVARLSTPSLEQPPLGFALPAVLDARYQIEGELGSGGMGKVFRAFDRKARRTVALKMPGISGIDPEILARFQREAQVLSQLKHPNLCTVYDIGAYQSIPYLVMEYVEGRPLSDWVNPLQPLEQRQAAMLLAQVAEAMEVAHQAGVIHRDLKPSNILLRSDGQPMIVDFGVARLKNSNLTLPRQLLGTPAYMSREQIENSRDEIGPVSDVYSLGVVLHELLTGTPAYEGPLLTVLARILHGPPPPAPRQIRSEIAPRLEQICLQAMASHAGARYQSMSALAHDLHAYLNSAEPTLLTLPTPAAPTALPNPSTRRAAEATPVIPLPHDTPGLPVAGSDELLAVQTFTCVTQNEAPEGTPPRIGTTLPTDRAQPILVAPPGLPLDPPALDPVPPLPFAAPLPGPLQTGPSWLPEPGPTPSRRRPWVFLLVFVPPLLVGVGIVAALLWPPHQVPGTGHVQISGPTETPPDGLPGDQQAHFRVLLPPELADLRLVVDGKEIKTGEWRTVSRGPHLVGVSGNGVEPFSQLVDVNDPQLEWRPPLEKLRQFGRVKIELAGYRAQAGPVHLRVEPPLAKPLQLDADQPLPIGTYTLRVSGDYLDELTQPVVVRRNQAHILALKPTWSSRVRLNLDHLTPTDKVSLGTSSSTAAQLGSVKLKTGGQRLRIDGKYVGVDEEVTLLAGENDLSPSKVQFYGYLSIQPPDYAEELLVDVDGDVQKLSNKTLVVKLTAGRHRVTITGPHVESATVTRMIEPGKELSYTPDYVYYGARQLKMAPAELARKATVTLDGKAIKDWAKALRATAGTHVLEISGTGLQTHTVTETFGRGPGKEINITLQHADELVLDLGNNMSLKLARVQGGQAAVGVGALEPLNDLDLAGLSKQQKVQLPAYWIGKFEVTQAQYRAVVGSLPKQSQPGDELPVTALTVQEMNDFCTALSKLTKRTLRLPSEHEWEFACRCGGTTPYNFGADRKNTQIRSGDANFDGKHPWEGDFDKDGQFKDRLVTVNDPAYPANAWGLHHMHGNVAEVCTDSWGGKVPYLLRGGSYKDTGFSCHAARRSPPLVQRSERVGFRVVCEIK